MTSTMQDSGIAGDFDPNPTKIARGTLVYLWAPGERPWEVPCRPILARVEKVTVDNIVGTDLRDGARAVYAVGRSVNLNQRWLWEIAAPPQRYADLDGVTHISGAALTLEQRVALICGEPGRMVRFTMRDGSSMSGVLTSLIQDCPNSLEADWFQLVGPLDPSGRQIQHWGRVPDIVSVTRTEDV